MRAELLPGLLPGLQQMAADYALMKDQWAAQIMKDQWAAQILNTGTVVNFAKPSPLPLSPKVALLAGVAAAVMRNPIISRRFWGP